MKSIVVLLNLLHHFYCGIQCDKTSSFVHGEAFEVKHEMPILDVELKRHTKLLQMFNFHQISSVCQQSCVFDNSVIFCELLNWKC